MREMGWSMGLMVLGLACGCGAGEIPVDVRGSSGAPSAGGSGQVGPSAGGSGQVGPSADPPLFGDETPASAMPGRCAKVDFLYVVDNSATMVDKQENLARSFANFSRIVSETLGTDDHQVMVIDTDGSNAADVVDSYDPIRRIDACDVVLGAGRRTGGDGEDCGLPGNQRYLTGDQRDVAGAFSCLARVGIFGNVDERAIDAMLAAAGVTVGDPEVCNAGFVRDDAVLVVTLITDEDDDRSRLEPASWKRQLLRAKGGNEQSVVMLGLIADNHVPGGLPGGPCDEFSGSPSPRLESFVESFELGSLGSVCAPDYSSFFAEAVSSIDSACDDFVPVVR